MRHVSAAWRVCQHAGEDQADINLVLRLRRVMTGQWPWRWLQIELPESTHVDEGEGVWAGGLAALQ